MSHELIHRNFSDKEKQKEKRRLRKKFRVSSIESRKLDQDKFVTVIRN